MKNKSDNLRFGITTGKKIGKAVKRTRARRVIRASYYELYPYMEKGYDIIFVARGKTPYVKSQVVKKAMKKHLKELIIAGIELSTAHNDESVHVLGYFNGEVPEEVKEFSKKQHEFRRERIKKMAYK